MRGILIFTSKKGYGFIKGEDEADYFVHHSSIEKGTFIKDDDPVSFDPAENERGKQAQNIKLIGNQ